MKAKQENTYTKRDLVISVASFTVFRRAYMAGDKFMVDLSKPLAFQVGHLGEGYDEWVHKPIISKESPRLYENGFLEFISLTPWWVVPMFWLPIVYSYVAYTVKEGVPPLYVLLSVLAGVAFLTFFEYFLHRYIFHFKPTTYWGITMHYAFHGFHHKHPADTLRLVLSPAATCVIAVLLWNPTKLMIPAPYSSAFFGGVVLGYVCYDCSHYFLHHGRAEGFLNQLKRNHMNHHFKDHSRGYGVTSNFWDKVFGTMPEKTTKHS